MTPVGSIQSPITEDGIWLDIRMERLTEARPALFLDRDGVIVPDTGFLSDPDTVTLMPGAAALIAAANRKAVPVAVVTNQSGIDRGLFDWTVFAAVQQNIERLLALHGAAIDALAACPFHPDFTDGYGAEHGAWRKPGPKMIRALADALNLDCARSWLIGDRPRDIEAARAAGLAGAVYVGTDSEAAPAGVSDAENSGFRLVTAEDLSDMVDIIPLRLAPADC